MKSFPTKPGISPQYLIRCVEVILVIALALALAGLARQLFPPPGDGEKPAVSLTGQPVQARPASPAHNAGSKRLSPAVLSLFGPAENPVSAPAHTEEELKETELDLTLKGILAHRETNRKLALIARGNNKAKVYRIGARIAGAEIIRIEARRAILLRNGVRETLTLEVKKPRRRRAANAAATDRAREGTTTVNEYEQAVTREPLDRQLHGLPELLTQAKTVPHRDNNDGMAGVARRED